MSSKVLRPGESDDARPVVWRTAGGAAGPTPALPTVLPGPTDGGVAATAAQAEARLKQARETGYREGESAGRRAAEAELRPVAERMTRSLEELAALRPVLMAQAEASLTKLSVAIAQRILHREITLDSDALAGIVKAALDQVQIQEVRRVRVHPGQVAALRAALEQNPAARSVEVHADASLGRGGMVVETSRGKLDASVDTQLAEIERGLADHLRRRA